MQTTQRFQLSEGDYNAVRDIRYIQNDEKILIAMGYGQLFSFDLKDRKVTLIKESFAHFGPEYQPYEEDISCLFSED